MFISLSGLLSRVKCNKDQRYVINEFIKHYALAKKAHLSGDKITVQDFFKLYVTGEEK